MLATPPKLPGTHSRLVIPRGCARPKTPGLAILAALAALATHAAAAVISTDVFDYQVHYHPDFATTNDAFASDANAQDVADFYDPASGTGLHQAYIDLGFRAPEFTNIFGPVKPTLLLDSAPFTGGRANCLFPDRIVLPPEDFRNNRSGFGTVRAKDLCAHELSHIVQYQYIPWGPDFLDLYPIGIEGTATAMEDVLGTDIDAGNLAQPFDKQTDFAHLANNYLVTDASTAFTFTSNITDSGDYFWSGDGYHSGLFWKYVMEQYGTARTEPGVGADAMGRFYELAEAHLDEGLTTLIQRLFDERNRYTTAASDPGVELREIFQDFTIANLLGGLGKTLSVTDAGRFQYVDDIVANSGSVPVTGFGSISVGNNTGTQTASAPRYGATYLKCSFAAPPNNNYGVGFFAQSQDSSKVWYAVAGERASGIIDFVYKGSVHPDEDNAFAYAAMSGTSDPYVCFHVIANGEDGPPPGAGFTSTNVGFDFNFAYFQPSLTIKEPSTAYRAFVGDAAAPERFLVKLQVTSPTYLGTGSVNGLTKDQFTVYVGSAIPSDQATVISAAYVLGEYWLTCQAPVKSPAPTTVQTLIVKLGGVTQTVENLVVYMQLNVDQMLVIDRSGSMTATSGGETRLEAARAAAQLFVDASGSDDQIGIVRFNGDAEVIPGLNLDAMSSQFERDLWNYIIDETNPAGDQIAATGSTSIGDGVLAATNDIIANGIPEAEKWIILLSDGQQNETTTWDDQVAAVKAEGIHVETIALGSGCDNNLLQSIATESSGKFYEVAAPNDTAASARTEYVANGSGGGGALPMMLDLANNYLLSSERIHRRERIVETSASLAAGASTTETLTLSEGGLTDCVVTVYSDKTNSIGLDITRPDTSTVAAPDAGDTNWNPDRYVSYRLPAMGDGAWTFHITNSGSAAAQYLFVVAGKNRQGVSAHVYFTQFHGNGTLYSQNGLYLRGLPMPIVAVLNDGNGQVSGATVLATITHPSRPPVTLLLRDDGGGYDGAANDGVYAGLYCATTEASYSGGAYAEGSPPLVTPAYQVMVTSSGKDNLNRNFQRVTRGAFNIYETENGGDTDSDGMPDRYEALHAGLNAAVNDASGDIDGDGLTNLQEYLQGPDPGLPDTDGGGETDASELANGANPLDCRDDAVPHALVARVIERLGDAQPPPALAYLRPAPSQNIIQFSVERGFRFVDIYRATAINGTYSPVTTVDASVSGGVYQDTGLTNGTTYFYYIQPRDASGRVGTKSIVFHGTPHADAQPPEGGMLLNGGSAFTTNTTVSVRFAVTADVTEFKIATSLGGLATAAWTPFSAFLPGFALGAPPSGTTRKVYALIRDSADNETQLVSAITYLAPAAAASVMGTVVVPADPDARKVTLSVKSATTHVQFFTGPAGTFNLPLPPDTYNILISQSGYQSFTLTGANLTAGTALNLGTITLGSLDSDGDSLADAAELRSLGTNRYAGDTDGDGQGDALEINILMTDPANPNSLLRIEGAPVVNRAAGTLTLTFQSVAGVSYHFEVSPDLTAWTNVLESGVPKTVTAAASQTTVTLNLPPAASRAFYRVTAP